MQLRYIENNKNIGKEKNLKIGKIQFEFVNIIHTYYYFYESKIFILDKLDILSVDFYNKKEIESLPQTYIFATQCRRPF